MTRALWRSGILLPAGNASAWTGPTGNNTYLLPGAVPTLIDAGVGKADHIDAIARALAGSSLALVLITHGHPDHVQGAPSIARRWPDVRIRQFGTGANPLAAGERIPAGDGTVSVLHTPGHSPDHCCFLAARDVFCGDLVRAGGTVVIPASRGGDLSAYLASLHRVRDLRPGRLLPGHGPIVEDPVALIDEYLRHRAEREQQILAVLDDGPASPEQIVGRVYKDLPVELIPAALESVLANLIKLQNERMVEEHENGWSLR